MSSNRPTDDPARDARRADAERIQHKQGGHHLPPHDDAPALDDTDRNTDKIIKPSRIHAR